MTLGVGETNFPEICNDCREMKRWKGPSKRRVQVCGCPTVEPKRAGASAKYARRKGALLERAQRKSLTDLGVTTARTQPGSGAYGTRNDIAHLQGDNAFTIGGKAFRQECKARNSDSGFAVIKGWMKDCEVLTIRQDRLEPFHVLSDEAFRHLIGSAQRGATEGQS